MPNHFHLVMETPQPNLVAGMKRLLGTYAARFNRRYKFFGHPFSGCYKTLKWIATELQTGSWTYVSRLLSRQRQQKNNV